MKKILLGLLLLTQFVFGQVNTSTVKAGKYQMNIPENGAKKDSVVVWDGVTKIMKILPVSEIKGTTNLNQLATPTGVTIFSSTGNDATLPLATSVNAGLQSPVDKAKMDGIANAATANQTDAYLLARENHTGTQAIVTVSGLQTVLDSKVDKVAGERLINAAEITKLSNQSGTNTGDQDLSGLVVKNAPITAATNTKITYDSKGLVTGGTSLIASDIPTLNQNTTGTASTITGSIAQSQVTNLVTDLSNKQSTSQKNTANGYAGLGADGKLISSQLPSITISDTFVTASQTAMLALVAETGDVAVRTDLNKSFILKGTNPTVLADWQELLTPTSAVTTVFGRNGAVTSQTGDYNTSQVPENTNLYYTEARVNANTNVAANTTARHSAVTLGTANGLSLSTQALSLGLSSTSTTGALSSTDWNTFNAKGSGTVTSVGSILHGTSGTAPNSSVTNASTTPQFSLNIPFAGNIGVTAGLLSKTDYDIFNGKENSIGSKNTAFNKNFGTAAGTVAEGNDSRINNGQTAYSWGNHSGLYFKYNPNRFNGDANTLGLGGTSGVFNMETGANIPSTYGTLYGSWNVDMSTQFFLSYNGDAYWRKSVGTTYTGSTWRTFLDSSNFNSYSPTLTGGGASGTWGINISGNSATATAFSNFSNGLSGGPISGTPTSIVGIGGSTDMQRFNSTAIQTFLGLGSNAYTSTAYFPVLGYLGNVNADTLLGNGVSCTASNAAGNYNYSTILTSSHGDSGSQINVHYGSGNLMVRGFWNYGSNFSPWRTMWHDGNFNPANYLPFTGGTLTGSLYGTNISSTGYFSLGTNNDNDSSGNPWYGLGKKTDSYVNLNGWAGIRLKTYAGSVLINQDGSTSFPGTTTASSFVTIGGTSSQYVKGDGSLSSTAPDARPYKVYTVLMYDNAGGFTQTVLENSLAGAISWVKTGVGLFEGTLPITYTSTKIACFMGQTAWDGQLICYSDGVKVYLQTRDNNHALGQYKMTGTPLEIRVYN